MIRLPRFMRLVALAVLLPLAACSEPETPATAPPGNPPLTDSPAATVKAALRLIREHLDAVRASDRSHARESREKLAWYIAARDELANRFGTRNDAQRTSAVVDTAVRNWSAMLSWVADAADEQAAWEEPGSAGRVRVLVPARVEQKDYRVRFRLLKTAEGWRISDIDLEPGGPGPSTRAVPATTPSMIPAPAPAAGPETQAAATRSAPP